MELRDALNMAERCTMARESLGTSSSTVRLLWEDNSSRAWTEREELAEIVACGVRTDLGIDADGSSQSYDEGGMENEGEDHVSKSRKVEKRRLHKHK